MISNMDNTNDAPAAIFTGIGLGLIVLLIVLWGFFGVIAMIVAPSDRRWTFFWLTFLMFGPVGILAAAVASPRDPAYFARIHRPAAAAATQINPRVPGAGK